MKNYIKSLWPLYLSEFLRSFSFYGSIWILFFQLRGLSLTQIGFTVTGTYIASLIFEYPSGIFADKYGRKTSLSISFLLSIIALIIQVTSHSMIQFYIGAFIIGISWTFSSGAREALIYDTLKQKKIEKENSKVLGQLDSIGLIGAIPSGLISSYLYTLNATIPYWLTISFCIFSFIIFTVLIKEPKYKEQDEVINPWLHFKDGLKIVLYNPTILSLLMLYFPLFFFEDAWYNAQQPIVISLGLPVIFLGAYHVCKNIVNMIGGVALPKVLKKFHHTSLIYGLIVAEAILWVSLSLNNLYLVIIFSAILMPLHMFWNYIDADIVHKHIPSKIRATALSARQMIISLIWIPIPWLMGFLVDTFDRNYLFKFFGILTLIFGTIIFISRKKYL